MQRLTSHSQQAGFSLIEILVVLVIISCVAGIGTHSLYLWQQRQAVRANAIQLYQFLGRVRQQADWYNQSLPLWVAEDRGSWCIGTGKPASQCGSQPWQWQATQLVTLVIMTGEPGFYGKHNAAWPGSFEVGNQYARWRIIISNQGRIRYCDAQSRECL